MFNSPFSLRGHPASAAYGPKSLAESSKPPSTVGEAKMGKKPEMCGGEGWFPPITQKKKMWVILGKQWERKEQVCFSYFLKVCN